jgi:excisionase family DNA binding protein
MAIAKEWYTVNEAAEYLGVSRRTVYKLCKESRLRTYILGKERTRRFRKDDLDKVPQPMGNGDEQEETEALTALTAAADPVLGELWSNEKDAAYDTA